MNIPEIKLGIIAVSRDCFPIALSTQRRKNIVAAFGEGLYECPITVENEKDALAALADVKAAGVNALVVFLGNFGPETPETLLCQKFDGPTMYIAAAEGDGDLINGRGDAYCGVLNCSYNLGMRHLKAYIPEYPVGTASEVADMIYKARGTKPIIAYASGYCCSGAYWIASACDKIYATDTAVIGSIGVVSIFEKDDENKTIEIVSSQSPNKRPNVETEEGKAKIQEHVDALADVFINKVALNRDISPKEVIKNFGGGDVFVGQKAVSIGLADGLSSFEELVSDLNLMEKSFMNEQKPTFSAEDIKMAERERMSQVFASELVKGKEETAQMLLAKTDMSASDILAVLGTIPTAAKTTDFEKAMASVPNPNISASVEEQEETPDMVAARIASYTMEGK